MVWKRFYVQLLLKLKKLQWLPICCHTIPVYKLFTRPRLNEMLCQRIIIKTNNMGTINSLLEWPFVLYGFVLYETEHDSIIPCFVLLKILKCWYVTYSMALQPFTESLASSSNLHQLSWCSIAVLQFHIPRSLTSVITPSHIYPSNQLAKM